MDFGPLIDGMSATIVVGGTALATVLRSGPRELATTWRSLAGLLAPAFSAERSKAGLAAQVNAIRRDGVLRVTPSLIGDREFDEASEAMIRMRSIDPLVDRHHEHRKQRMTQANIAVRTLAQASELGPVFGMVGTLVSLSRLPEAGINAGALNSAIGMAVVTTLYGLLLANLLLAPLARMIERHALAEEQARQDVIDWLSVQLEPALPHKIQPMRAPVVWQERQHA